VDRTTLTRTVRQLWDESVLPSLAELVAIPAVSSGFDPRWQEGGHLTAAVEHVQKWLGGRGTAGAEHAGTVLLYGHLDKQPPAGGWSEGLGPWTPVVRDGRLYGRGSADDGYAGYAATTAIESVRAAGGEHARCVLLLETGEESGSPDLPAYLDHLRDRLGEVSLVVCLDSGGSDFQRLWLTTSLRGLVQADVTVRVLESGQHSGLASGIVPSSFRVLRQLLDRLEDARTGEIRLPELHVELPAERLTEIRDAVAAAPGALDGVFPVVPGARLVETDEVTLTVNGTWRPTLSVTGADGLPAPSDAGNVLRPFTTLCLSFRLPPTADSERALDAVRRALTTDVPYGARVELGRIEAADGWNAPELAPWLRSALDDASEQVFGAPWRALGLGGSIPFMGLLHEAYPDAQFLITGVLGPGSNAHVPDESLDLGYAAQVTEAVALVLQAHAAGHR